MLNIIGGWVGIFLGCVLGAVQGIFFYGEEFLGGYGSWKRRISRLGHISFFGIGFVNIAFGITIKLLNIEGDTAVCSYLLMVGLVTMPLICYLSAIRDFFRHVFFIPALCVMTGLILFLWRLIQL